MDLHAWRRPKSWNRGIPLPHFGIQLLIDKLYISISAFCFYLRSVFLLIFHAHIFHLRLCKGGVRPLQSAYFVHVRNSERKIASHEFLAQASKTLFLKVFPGNQRYGTLQERDSLLFGLVLHDGPLAKAKGLA